MARREPSERTNGKLPKCHVNAEPNLNGKRVKVHALQDKLVVHAAACSKNGPQHHANHPAVAKEMPHFLATSQTQAHVRTDTYCNADPLERKRAFPHERDRNKDRKNGRKRTDRGCNAQWQVSQRVICQNPAATHDGRLPEQVNMALQRQAFTVARQKERAHKQGIKSTAKEQRHTDCIILHRLFLGKVITA